MIYNQKKIQSSNQSLRRPTQKSNSLASDIDIKLSSNDSVKKYDVSLSNIKNRTAFIRKPIRKQQMTQLFQTVYDKISRPNIQSRRTKIFATQQLKDMTKKQSQGLPVNILNTLYRQNIKNYNAYTATLQATQQDQTLSSVAKQRISKLCHIGAAKQFLKSKKYSQSPSYNRVNILIRQYMRQKMYEDMKGKQQKYQNVIFIPTNQLALNFNPYSYPKDLQLSIEPKQYVSTIKHVNQIIQKQYVSYKASNFHMFTQSLMAKIVLALIVILVFAYFLQPAKQILGIVFGLVLIWVLLCVHQCGSQLQELVRSKNVTNTIQQKITCYFQKISSQQVEWRVGTDFYWLEVHFIKKKKMYKFK